MSEDHDSPHGAAFAVPDSGTYEPARGSLAAELDAAGQLDRFWTSERPNLKQQRDGGWRGSSDLAERNGSSFTVSADGAWYSHRDGAGGGILEYLVHAGRLDRSASAADARDYLAEHGYLRPRRDAVPQVLSGRLTEQGARAYTMR